MPISEGRLRGAALCCLALTLGSPKALAARTFTPLEGAPVVSVAVQGGALTVAGPEGYCIDGTATRDRPDGAFVMLGPCYRLFFEATGQPEIPAVLTAAVSGATDIVQRPSPTQLERYFRTPDGQAALSVDGEAATVDIQQTRVSGDVLYMLVRDSSVARPEGLVDTNWRAVFALGGRVVSLAATAHIEEPRDLADLLGLLRSFVTRMTAENTNGAALDEGRRP